MKINKTCCSIHIWPIMVGKIEITRKNYKGKCVKDEERKRPANKIIK